jgi:metal-sulfur cluster biosynthetic enzyme
MTSLPYRLEQVRAALDTVTDPEIDESVAALEFISGIEVSDENDVSIEFRLPTFWCAPNFAFMMASDMRDAVKEMDWVRSVSVKLLDHFSADLINRGVALKQDFRDAFPGETDDDLASVRLRFLGKAFERRQELLIRHLLGTSYKGEWITRVSLKDLMGLSLDSEGTRLRTLYIFAWRRLHPEWPEASLAFVALSGDPLDPGQLPSYMRKIGGVRRNAEYNGFICRSLLAERKAECGETVNGETAYRRIGVSVNGER